MTCKDCGAPIHWAEHGTEDGGAWYHDQLIDSWNCPADWAAPIEPARPAPISLDGCTCGGISDTGGHFAGCAWAGV